MVRSVTIQHGDVQYLQFGLVSDEYILSRSVVNLTDAEQLPMRKNKPIVNSVNDPRLGTVCADILCSTCGQTTDFCSGHIGHVHLKDPVFSAHFLPLVERLFSSLCIRCAQVLVPAHVSFPISTHPKEGIPYVYKKAHKVQVCPHCDCVQPQWILQQRLILRPVWPEGHVVPHVGPQHLYTMLQNVPDEQMRWLGFDPTYSHIGSIMHKVHLVSPKIIRPTRSVRHENDLTIRTREIIKVNRECTLVNPNLSLAYGEKEVEQTPPDWKFRHVRNKKPIVPYQLEQYFELVRQCVGFQDARMVNKNDLDYGRELQCIRTRFCSTRNKRGRMRGNLLGKRGNFTARGVASPSTHIDPHQVGVPKYVCMRITIADRVTTFNYDRLLRIVLNGPHAYPGANEIERDGHLFRLPLFCDGGLRLGDVVHRHLQQGDIVIMNRQPSLHRYSMMAYEVVPSNHLSFQLHLAVTKAHNLDFDGDEVNMFIPGSIQSRAEALTLLAVNENVFREAKLLVGFVQHACLGVYILTGDHVVLPVRLVQQLLYAARVDLVYLSTALAGEMVTGRDVLASLLPTYNGQDQVDKNQLNMLVGRYLRTVPTHRRTKYIGQLTRVLERFLEWHGSTLSLQDCYVPTASSRVRSLLLNSQLQHMCTVEGGGGEDDLVDILAGMRDHVGKYTYDTLQRRGSRLCTIIGSGAKGNVTHIVQNAGIVGQQLDMLGSRNQPLHSHECDPFVHRGFVTGSFSSGLGPIEFFHHLAASRLGLISTAVSTSDTGYSYRRISKCLEDLRVAPDYTVRDAGGRVILLHSLFDTTLVSIPYSVEHLQHVNICEYYHQPPAEEAAYLTRLQARLVHQKHSHLTLHLPVQLHRARTDVPEPSSVRCQQFRLVLRAWAQLCHCCTLPHDRSILEYIYFDTFATRHLGTISTEVLPSLLADTQEQLVRGLKVPGCPIGLVASQSFSEPLTQMQLNQFHRSGEKSTLVGGVVRIKEILNLLKVQKTPSMCIVAHHGADVQPMTLIQVRVCSFVTGWVRRDPCTASIRLDRDRLIQIEHSPRMLVTCIQQQLPFKVSETIQVLSWTTTLEEPTWYVHLRYRTSEAISTQAFKRWVDGILGTTLTHQGVRGIEDYYVETRTYNQEERTCIITKGTNLRQVCNLPWVDSSLTTSNSILETYQEFGIGAARRAIVRELGMVLQTPFTGLIASAMCMSGTPCALTFAGLAQQRHTSRLKLASFERSMESFSDAGMSSYYDTLHGISEAVMMGKQVSTGSGFTQLIPAPSFSVQRDSTYQDKQTQWSMSSDSDLLPIPADVTTYSHLPPFKQPLARTVSERRSSKKRKTHTHAASPAVTILNTQEAAVCPTRDSAKRRRPDIHKKRTTIGNTIGESELSPGDISQTFNFTLECDVFIPYNRNIH